MAQKGRRWVRVKALGPKEKSAIATTCERFITEILKPRFLPEVRPTSFNYPVDIFGKWRGSRYSFIMRYRSALPTMLMKHSMPHSRALIMWKNVSRKLGST